MDNVHDEDGKIRMKKGGRTMNEKLRKVLKKRYEAEIEDAKVQNTML